MNLAILSPDDARSLMRYLYRYSDDLTPAASEALHAHPNMFVRMPESVPRRTVPPFTESLIDMVCSDAGKRICELVGMTMFQLGALLFVQFKLTHDIHVAVEMAKMGEAVGEA